MILSPFAKGSLAVLALGGASAATYGAWRWYDNFFKSKNGNFSLEPKKLTSNYIEVFSGDMCSDVFGSDALKQEDLLTSTSNETIKLGEGDFLSDIEKTEWGCFYMKTNKSKDGKSVVGVAELSAYSDKYGVIMQSTFNLGKEDSINNGYFLNKISFLNKTGNDKKDWVLDKSFAWKEDDIKIKKSNELIDDSQKVIRFWSKKESNNENNDEFLFKKFDFKTPTKFWKDGEKTDFVFESKDIIFWCSPKDKKWYKGEDGKITIENKAKDKNIPKIKWFVWNENEYKKILDDLEKITSGVSN